MRRVPITLLAAAALGGSPHAAAGQFEALRARIEAAHARSVEEVLPLMPADLLARYALVFRSRSLQGATYVDPRVILYSRDASFVVTFNGDDSEAGFDTLETMEFDDLRKEFSLREISFPRGGSGDPREQPARPHTRPAEPDQPPAEPGPRRVDAVLTATAADVPAASASNLPAAVFSERNPAKCARCHGAPAKPVWDAAPLWPGVYGERYHARLSKPESDGLDAFLRRLPDHPRYHFLRRVEALASREAFYPSARARYEGREVEPPNAQLAALLGKHNFLRIGAELAAAPGFEPFKYVLLAAASGGCGPVREYFPDEMSGEFDVRYGAFIQRIGTARRRQESGKGERMSHGAGAGPAMRDDALTDLRFIVEAGLGVDTAQWSLALERDADDFFAGQAASVALAPLLRSRVARSDPSVLDLSFYRDFTSEDRYCAHLRRRSRTALAGSVFATAGMPLTAAPVPPLVAHCAGCHSSGAAPAIPFDDPARLARALPRTDYPHGTLMDEISFRLSAAAGPGRMPLDLYLGDSERADLEAYFKSLLGRAPP